MKGAPLSPHGYFGVVYRLAADLEWFQKRLGMRFAPAANLPCPFCDGGRPPNPAFLDLRRTAEWLATCKTFPAAEPSDHAVWSLAGVCLFCATIDPMHSGDLGIVAHFVGSCFHTFLYEGPLAGTIREREELLSDMINETYQSLGTTSRLTNFGRWLWADASAPHQQFPVLTAKAAECRHLVRVVARLCERLHGGSPRGAARLKAAGHLESYYEILAKSGYFLKAEEHEAAKAHMFDFMDQYQRLALEAASRNCLAWNVVNKHHMMARQALQSKRLNPEATWAFPYEDLMGRMKRVAMASKAGIRLAKAPRTIMLKYKHVLHLALESADC